MKTYSTIEQINADIVDGVLTVEDDVTFKVSFSIDASIRVEGDIKASDIKAWNIHARDINALDINARDIHALNINAFDINASDINALDISFYAVCFAYTALVCKSIVGRRENNKYFCLDSEVIIKN